VALTKWVSNPVLIDKKGGSIRVCVDYLGYQQSLSKGQFSNPFR